MSLLNVATLKSQAARLVAYMGDKHRFRLRESSALEAMAAMHKVANWNTLLAIAVAHRSTDQLTGLPPQVLAIEPGVLPLAWGSAGAPTLSVSTVDWYRHSLALAMSSSTREKWSAQHFVEALSAGCAGVFINALGGVLGDLQSDLLERDCLLDVSSGKGFRLNLLKDMQADMAAWLLADVMSISSTAPCLQPSTKRKAIQVLEAALTSLRIRGDAPTLQAVAAVCGSPEQLGSAHSDDGLDFALEDFLKMGSCLAEELLVLARENWCAQLLSEDHAVPGLSSLLHEGRCLALQGVEGPALVATFYALRGILAYRQSLPRAERSPGLVFGVGDANAAPLALLLRLIEQGRSASIAVLLTAESKEALLKHDEGAYVVGNLRNVVHLDGLSEEALMRVLRSAASGPVLEQAGLTIIPSA